MERRRFVPRSEGLEARELLSGPGAEPPTGPVPPPDAPVVLRDRPVAVAGWPSGELPPEAHQTAAPIPQRAEVTQRDERAARRPRLRVSPDDPNIAPLRRFRIDRLPTLLDSIHPGREVPPELVDALQDDLRLIAGKLKPPPSNALFAFNLQLRSTLGRASLTERDAAALNRLFGLVLGRAGAEPDVIAQFQEDMNALAHFDAQSPTPAIDAANDYGLMLQTALGVGFDFESFQNRPRPNGFAPGTIGASRTFGF